MYRHAGPGMAQPYLSAAPRGQMASNTSMPSRAVPCGGASASRPQFGAGSQQTMRQPEQMSLSSRSVGSTTAPGLHQDPLPQRTAPQLGRPGSLDDVPSQRSLLPLGRPGQHPAPEAESRQARASAPIGSAVGDAFRDAADDNDDQRSAYLLAKPCGAASLFAGRDELPREGGSALVPTPQERAPSSGSTHRPSGSLQLPSRFEATGSSRSSAEPAPTSVKSPTAGGSAMGTLGAAFGAIGAAVGWSSSSRQSAAEMKQPIAGSATAAPLAACGTKPESHGELQARIRELDRRNEELEKKLDDDGKQFLEALFSLENEIEELQKQNKRLTDERSQTEDQLRKQGTDGELRAKNLKLEHDHQDMLQQMDELMQEKEEETKRLRIEGENQSRQLAEQARAFQRKLADSERERTNLLEAITEEAREFEARISKLTADKEQLSIDLAKALAQADLPAQQRGVARPEANDQLRALLAEKEALKDEATAKDGEIDRLKSQLAIVDRKLRIADVENTMLKNEIESKRPGAAPPGNNDCMAGVGRGGPASTGGVGRVGGAGNVGRVLGSQRLARPGRQEMNGQFS